MCLFVSIVLINRKISMFAFEFKVKGKRRNLIVYSKTFSIVGTYKNNGTRKRKNEDFRFFPRFSSHSVKLRPRWAFIMINLIRNPYFFSLFLPFSHLNMDNKRMAETKAMEMANSFSSAFLLHQTKEKC